MPSEFKKRFQFAKNKAIKQFDISGEVGSSSYSGVYKSEKYRNLVFKLQSTIRIYKDEFTQLKHQTELAIKNGISIPKIHGFKVYNPNALLIILDKIEGWKIPAVDDCKDLIEMKNIWDELSKIPQSAYQKLLNDLLKLNQLGFSLCDLNGTDYIFNSKSTPPTIYITDMQTLSGFEEDENGVPFGERVILEGEELADINTSLMKGFLGDIAIIKNREGFLGLSTMFLQYSRFYGLDSVLDLIQLLFDAEIIYGEGIKRNQGEIEVKIDDKFYSLKKLKNSKMDI